MTTQLRLFAAMAITLFLTACSGMTGEAATSVAITTAGGLAAIAKAWSDAGIIPPESAAKFIGGLTSVENFVQAGVESAKLFAEALAQQKALIEAAARQAAEAKAAAAAAADASLSPEAVTGIAAAGTGLAVATTNVMRNRARISRHEPVGKQPVSE